MTGRDLTPEVETYLASVARALDDLPPDERDDLLADVTASLLETAGESEGLIAARLGPPEDFAAELRAAAGLQTAGARPSRRRERLRRLAADPRLAAARRVLAELAPIWWVVRAYLAVVALTLVTGSRWSIAHPAFPRIGSAHVTFVLLAVALVVSVALGLLGRRRAAPGPVLAAAIAANVALLLAVPTALSHLRQAPAPTVLSYSFPSEPPPGLAYNGQPLHNLYPYTRDGKLLHDVFLFTEYGTPLDIGPGTPDPDRRYLVTKRGDRVYNSFPIRYFDPGTARVSHPNAGPPVRTPHLLTPPLLAVVRRR